MDVLVVDGRDVAQRVIKPLGDPRGDTAHRGLLDVLDNHDGAAPTSWQRSTERGSLGRRSTTTRAAHRLLVPLPHDRCLARLGLGVRVVALTSAALDSSCGSHLACVTRTPTYERERLKRGLLSSK